jgi:hypothetical protein
MNIEILSDLIKVANKLDSIGLRSEADFLDNLIYKISQSIETKLDSPQKKLIFLIGYPSSGKSYWIKANPIPNSSVINRDDIVEAKAKELSVGDGTYNDMFYGLSENLTEKPTPSAEELNNYDSNPEYKKRIDDYLSSLGPLSDKYNSDSANSDIIEKYGKLKPYDFNLLKKVITVFGVPPKSVNPFYFEKVKLGSDKSDEEYISNIKDAVNKDKNLIIDMMNLSVGSRNSIRFHLGDKIGEYDQIAIVFTDEEDQFSPETKEKILQVKNMRAEEMRSQGRPKDIPDSVYQKNFQRPEASEGFSKIIYLGTPSLKKLKKKSLKKLQ